MDGSSGQSSASPVKILRNGMDYEPKKTYPPDYSNVPSVRDWQMSPFSNERFDLNEIQKAEKKGFKGRFELERIKNEMAGKSSGSEPPQKKKSECQVCAERKAAQRQEIAQKTKCSYEYLYQPYGPNIVSSMSYSKPESNRPKMYTYMGPSHYASYRFKVPAPGTVSPLACQDIELAKRNRNFKNVYIPYGPMGEIRMTPDMYVPMGPSVFPLLEA